MEEELDKQLFLRSNRRIKLTEEGKRIQNEYPLVHFHVISGDQETILDELDRVLIDSSILFGTFDHSKYETLSPDYADHFGILMRKDDNSFLNQRLFGKNIRFFLTPRKNIYRPIKKCFLPITKIRLPMNTLCEHCQTYCFS